MYYFFFSWFQKEFNFKIDHEYEEELRHICLGGDKGYYKIDNQQIMGASVLLTDTAVEAAAADGRNFFAVAACFLEFFRFFCSCATRFDC